MLINHAFLQSNVDLFASQPAPSAVSATIDFFAAPNPPSQIAINASKVDQTSSNVVDPFANVPLQNFDVSDTFGSFSSSTDSMSTISNQSSSIQGSTGSTKGASFETKAPQHKDPFQVKSGIWADSLSRGLIDLNIAARKYLCAAPII